MGNHIPIAKFLLNFHHGKMLLITQSDPFLHYFIPINDFRIFNPFQRTVLIDSIFFMLYLGSQFLTFVEYASTNQQSSKNYTEGFDIRTSTRENCIVSICVNTVQQICKQRHNPKDNGIFTDLWNVKLQSSHSKGLILTYSVVES